MITESYLRDGDGVRLCNALSHFLQLFDFAALPELREQLFNATALLVTQSKNAVNHLEYIETAIAYLSDP